MKVLALKRAKSKCKNLPIAFWKETCSFQRVARATLAMPKTVKVATSSWGTLPEGYWGNFSCFSNYFFLAVPTSS